MSNTKLSARERIHSLLDDSSFVEIGAYVTSRNTDFNLNREKSPADGVITGYGVIDGNLVYVYSQDAEVFGGAVGEMHAKKIARLYDLALKVGAPVIGLIDCAGLRLQEAVDALNGFGEIFYRQTQASGVIPQVTGLFGVCGGGTALIPTLTDFTFMSKDNAKLFVNSPNALEGNIASKLDTSSADFHEENTSMVDVIGKNDLDVLGQIRQLITMIPANNEDDMSYIECHDDLNRIVAGLDTLAHDARTIFRSISDNSCYMELKTGYAKDMVTAFIRLNGNTIGCVGNQLSESSGYLTTKGAMKAAEFVTICDSFNIPLLSITSVKGFKATVHEERTIAKAAAKLTYAFANATVPKVSLIVGDAFGSAYIAMNSKSIGADVVFAWPTGRIGMMDETEAARIMYADEIEKAEDKAAFLNEKAAEYAALQSSVESAAARGYVDDIIEPDATRKRLIAAFDMLYTKREEQPAKKHGTV